MTQPQNEYQDVKELHNVLESLKYQFYQCNSFLDFKGVPLFVHGNSMLSLYGRLIRYAEIVDHGKCNWEIKHDKDRSYWNTRCGQQYGAKHPHDTKRTGWNYCPFCGGEIVNDHDIVNVEDREQPKCG